MSAKISSIVSVVLVIPSLLTLGLFVLLLNIAVLNGFNEREDATYLVSLGVAESYFILDPTALAFQQNIFRTLQDVF